MEDQTGGKELSGKALVDELFLKRLEADGLVKSPKVKLADQDVFRKKLRDRLAYMNAENLGRLADLVLQSAGGQLRNVWPSYATIWNLAFQMQRPPDRENPIVRSWLMSIEGPKLRDAGELVEMYVTLRRLGRPPLQMDLRLVTEEANANKRRREIVGARVRAGTADEDDRRWFDWYGDVHRHCLELVSEGEVGRAAKVVA